MRIPAQSALILLLLGHLAVPPGFAQKQGGSSEGYRSAQSASQDQTPRPLNLDEGLAILGAALDSRHHAAFRTDCSHFVHGLYTRAGFPYAYSPSSDLYAGIDDFRRVTNPQPGDLAAWPGHVGIVINPAQHTFFSLLRSGPGVASYDTGYWKRRGRPHFYRYLTPVPPGVLSSSLRSAPR